MSILIPAIKAIGRFLSGDDQPIQKSEILVYINAEQEALSEVGKWLTTTDLQELLVIGLFNKDMVDQDPEVLRAAASYKTFLRKLTGSARITDMRDPMKPLRETYLVIQKNIDAIQNDFLKLFDEQGSSVGASDARLSMLVLFGYLTQVSMFSTWTSFLIGALVPDPTETTPPPYRQKFIDDYVDDVASFVSIALTNQRKTVVDQILTMRKDGKDLFLTSNGQTIDQYSSDDALDLPEKLTLKGAMRNPLAMFLSWREDRRHAAIERLQRRTNWLRAKVAQHALKMSRADPDSPEYKNATKVLGKYSDLMTDSDRRLKELLA